jgi:hypothetical protein
MVYTILQLMLIVLVVETIKDGSKLLTFLVAHTLLPIVRLLVPLPCSIARPIISVHQYVNCTLVLVVYQLKLVQPQ